MSWKVLIADDEQIIREGIRDSMDWSALQLDVVAEAEDGEEALWLAKQHQVNIMLVDINMPIMNGINLIKEIRKQIPDCKVIIITGHDEFSYAQEAIRLQVDDYIMKPVNPNQLFSVLDKIREDLFLEEKQSSYLKLAEEQIEKNIPLLRERFCLEWMEGNISQEELKDKLHFLQLPSVPPKMIGMIKWPEIETNQPLMRESDRQLLHFAIQNIVTEYFQESKKVLSRDNTGKLIIILWDKVATEDIEELGKLIQQYLKISIYLHFQLVDKHNEISHAYRECQQELLNKIEISPIVRKAEQFMLENFYDPQISLEKVAQSLFVSPEYLSRLVKQDLGISFVQLLTQLRIYKAIELLNSTDLSIHEISNQIGYDTQHYFSTVFKKMMGVSPMQYRNGMAEKKSKNYIK